MSQSGLVGAKPPPHHSFRPLTPRVFLPLPPLPPCSSRDISPNPLPPLLHPPFKPSPLAPPATPPLQALIIPCSPCPLATPHPLPRLAPFPPPPPPALQGYSSWLSGIIARCLSPDPTRRPSSETLLQECTMRMWELAGQQQLQLQQQQQLLLHAVGAGHDIPVSLAP